MRIAGGVLMIIVAVLYLIAGLGYMAGGAVTAGAGGLAAKAAEEAAKDPDMTAEKKEEMDKALAELKSQGAAAGGGLMFYGIYLLVSAGVGIAAAVQLFRNKGKTLIFVGGGMVLVAEIVGAVLTSFGLTQIIGLVAAVLAILAAKSMGQGEGSTPAAA